MNWSIIRTSHNHGYVKYSTYMFRDAFLLFKPKKMLKGNRKQKNFFQNTTP